MQETLSKLLHVSAADAKSFARCRTYPATNQFEIMAASRPIFGGGWESDAPKKAAGRRSSAPDDRAERRARRRVRDLSLSNKFDYFVTLTLDKSKVDRYDAAAVGAKLRRWLSNQVQRKGLQYILVPELHQDGAIHFHGFFNSALPVVESGTFTNVPDERRSGKRRSRPAKPRSNAQRLRWLEAGAQPVYNLPAWPLGFSTAVRLYGDYPAAVAYVCKYVSKDGQKIGGRWFYSGGGLAEPVDVPVEATVDEIAAIDGAYYSELPGIRLRLAAVRGDMGECNFWDK